MNIELSWQKKNPNLFITGEPIIKGQLFYLSYWSRKSHFYLAMRATRRSNHLQSKGNTFISRYLLAHVQLPSPLTLELVI